MKEHDVGAVVVADAQVRGLLTDRDIVARATAQAATGSRRASETSAAAALADISAAPTNR